MNSSPPDGANGAALPTPSSLAISQAIQLVSIPSAISERISVATFALADLADSTPAGDALTLQPLSGWASPGVLASLSPSLTPTPVVSSSSTWSESAEPGASVALDLGAAGSALLVPAGDTFTALGAPDALHILLPGAKGAAQAGSLALGSAPGPASFSDTFSGAALDPRWLVSGGVASAATGALTLTPSPAATASAGGLATVVAAQGAPSSNFTVTVQVTPAYQNSVTQSGLTLQLDDWHRVTLALRMERQDQRYQNTPTVALCATVRAQAPWCQTVSLPAHAALAHVVWLRISQSGATLTGSMSVDGTTWTRVGAWTVAWRPTAGAQIGAYAPPAAEIITSGAPDTAPTFVGPVTPGVSVWPNFTSIALFVTAPTATTNQPASQPDDQFSAFSVR